VDDHGDETKDSHENERRLLTIIPVSPLLVCVCNLNVLKSGDVDKLAEVYI